MKIPEQVLNSPGFGICESQKSMNSQFQVKFVKIPEFSGFTNREFTIPKNPETNFKKSWVLGFVNGENQWIHNPEKSQYKF